MMWYRGGGGWGWGAWLAMLFMMVVFWGVIAWVVVTLIRHGSRPPDRTLGTPASDPVRILDERFARGEIDEDAYKRGRELLRGGS